MKQFQFLIPVIFLGLLGCKKEIAAPRPASTVPVVNTPPPGNTAPKVSAGANYGIMLPVNSALLHGWATDAENNIDSAMWRQLSGPGQAIIQTPDLYKTNISNLIRGTYSFELTVIDKGGLRGKDTTQVFVIDSIESNIVKLEVLEVDCPWGPDCSVLVDTTNTHIYRNLPFQVFIKSIDTSVWTEISHHNYYFTNNEKHFWFNWNVADYSIKWEVMVVY